MTKSEADKKAAAMLAGRSMQDLIEMREMTSAQSGMAAFTTRGWLMDEFHRRNPEGFDKWIDSLDPKDEALRDYMLA